MLPPADADLVNASPDADALVREAVEGLSATPKRLPPKLFYDDEGSRLFEQICDLPEYYLTRTEIGILEDNLDEIAAALGPEVQVIEPGSGAGLKTRILLGALERPAGYVPIEISLEALTAATKRLQARFPDLEIQGVCADFLAPLDLPTPSRPPRRRVVFFPGSSIGNFEREDARDFLDRMARLVGPGGGLLIGFDRRKEAAVLEAAYDDAQGVTAAFNRNVLHRLNREAGADFDMAAFAHRSVWNEARSRVEMHLASTREQTVHVGGHAFGFAAGETIHTESSYKFGPEGVDGLSDRWRHVRTWHDADERFGVQFLEVPTPAP